MMYFFDENLDVILKDESLVFGGKAASLRFLAKNGFQIPAGFVITKLKDFEKIMSAFQKLKSRFVSVRSSANCEDGNYDSFAGQFETFLFVNEENLLQKIQACFDSIHSERIRNYAVSKGINFKNIRMRVIVQTMVNADVAGVCFTKHPVTRDENQIVIEAAFGLGEAVVSGEVTPDLYVLKKSTGEIFEKNIEYQVEKIVLDLKHGGTKKMRISEENRSTAKLSDQQLQEIYREACAIEKLYDKPMDIEWAFEKGKLYILQARPITV